MTFKHFLGHIEALVYFCIFGVFLYFSYVFLYFGRIFFVCMINLKLSVTLQHLLSHVEALVKFTGSDNSNVVI